MVRYCRFYYYPVEPAGKQRTKDHLYSFFPKKLLKVGFFSFSDFIVFLFLRAEPTAFAMVKMNPMTMNIRIPLACWVMLGPPDFRNLFDTFPFKEH